MGGVTMWGLVSVAMAGTPVLHDGGTAEAAIEAASSRSGLPASQLDAVSLDTLLKAPPTTLGDAVLRRCTRNRTTNAEVRAEVARAEAAFLRHDPIAVMDHLDLAVATLGCLGELVEPDPASSVFRVRAAQQLIEGRVDDARGELRTSLALVPALTWPSTWPPAGLDLLAELGTTPPTAVLSVLPPATASGPWLDGRPITEGRTVGTGLHLFQYGGPTGIQSAWVVIGGPATFVVPTSARRPILEALPSGGAPLVEGLFAASYADFFAGYVAHGGGVWLVTKSSEGPANGKFETTQLAAPPVPEPVVPEKGRKKKKRDKAAKK